MPIDIKSENFNGHIHTLAHSNIPESFINQCETRIKHASQRLENNDFISAIGILKELNILLSLPKESISDQIQEKLLSEIKYQADNLFLKLVNLVKKLIDETYIWENDQQFSKISVVNQDQYQNTVCIKDILFACSFLGLSGYFVESQISCFFYTFIQQIYTKNDILIEKYSTKNSTVLSIRSDRSSEISSKGLKQEIIVEYLETTFEFLFCSVLEGYFDLESKNVNSIDNQLGKIIYETMIFTQQSIRSDVVSNKDYLMFFIPLKLKDAITIKYEGLKTPVDIYSQEKLNIVFNNLCGIYLDYVIDLFRSNFNLEILEFNTVKEVLRCLCIGNYFSTENSDLKEMKHHTNSKYVITSRSIRFLRLLFDFLFLQSLSKSSNQMKTESFDNHNYEISKYLYPTPLEGSNKINRLKKKNIELMKNNTMSQHLIFSGVLKMLDTFISQISINNSTNNGGTVDYLFYRYSDYRTITGFLSLISSTFGNESKLSECSLSGYILDLQECSEKALVAIFNESKHYLLNTLDELAPETIFSNNNDIKVNESIEKAIVYGKHTFRLADKFMNSEIFGRFKNFVVSIISTSLRACIEYCREKEFSEDQIECLLEIIYEVESLYGYSENHEILELPVSLIFLKKWIQSKLY
ncbi:hypothetical protein BB559_001209 [Furculomyces boomerangus]|uniref:Uncharacterized protein n=1 Tax=Furculomyces boomerangus TaxID=61424 RepID=A0A2T9Z2Q6_9FUNG|nr:hypothetical protein BB559_001209 [Furculomyces boomerangus]